MAIAFARTSIHTRTQGHSAVAGAAYRAGVSLFDERTGETHDFSNRVDVAFSEILLPENGDAAFLNRETLWNRVEGCERRKDSQVAKDVVLALPKELELSDHISLARHFAKYHFVDKGLVVDIAIHNHGDGNPHAHLYVTTRRLLGSHFDKYKARDLNPSFANWKGGNGFVSEQDYWGEQWRVFQDDFFKAHAMDVLVDENHLIPERHEGRIGKGERHYLKEGNQLQKKAALHVALHDSDNLLNVLSSRHAVFSERQMQSLVFKSTETPEQFQAALLQLKNHTDMVCLGLGQDGRLHYTTRANYLKEVKLGEQALSLLNTHQHPVSARTLKKTLKDYTLTEEQGAAVKHIAEPQGIAAIVGRAGTGKSYLLRAAADVWQRQGYELHGISLSGIAAKGLSESSGIPASTIASFKQKLHVGRVELTNKSIIIMDEAGMTNLQDMSFVVEQVKQAGAKLVLVGDTAQLQPIGPGAPFRALIEHTGFVALSDIKRQNHQADRDASKQLALGHMDEALTHYEQKGALHWDDTPQDAMQALVAGWQQSINKTADLPNHIILAHRNCDVAALNDIARGALVDKGLVKEKNQDIEITKRVPGEDGFSINIEKEVKPFAVGDKILFRRNDKTLGVVNGDFATISQLQHNNLTVTFNDQRKLTFSTQDYHEFDYGYAATVHKAQGTTVDKVYVYAGGHGWNRHLAYVALTRHRDSVSLHIDRETYANESALKQKFKTQEIRDSVLDWPINFATRRGFDPESLIGRFISTIKNIKVNVTDVWQFISNHLEKSQQPKNKTGLTHETPADLLNSSKEWDKLATIESPFIQGVIKAKSRLDKPNQPFDIDIYTRAYENEIKELYNQKDIFATVKKVSPSLAKQFQKISEPPKAITIDWLSNEFKDEFDKLKQSKDPLHQYMVKFRGWLRADKGTNKETFDMKQLNSIALEAVRYPSSEAALKKFAPKLTLSLKAFSKYQSKQQEIGRDLYD